MKGKVVARHRVAVAVGIVAFTLGAALGAGSNSNKSEMHKQTATIEALTAEKAALQRQIDKAAAEQKAARERAVVEQQAAAEQRAAAEAEVAAARARHQ